MWFFSIETLEVPRGENLLYPAIYQSFRIKGDKELLRQAKTKKVHEY